MKTISAIAASLALISQFSVACSQGPGTEEAPAVSGGAFNGDAKEPTAPDTPKKSDGEAEATDPASPVTPVVVPPDLSSDYSDVSLTSAVSGVQPMTGIVLWNSGGDGARPEIQLEYSYVGFDSIAKEKSPEDWDWSGVEKLLDSVASHQHQAILRFYYTYPGDETTVPPYIKALADYQESNGNTEGKNTWFPDWSHDELKSFTKTFYTEFARRYDTDPRMAFLQVGFGLWGEFHIYEPGVKLGVNFPDKAYQQEFFEHLGGVFSELHWSVSIDAAENSRTPFSSVPSLKALPFGLFDDSFLHSNHQGYNKDCFDFFGAAKRLASPIGGEFSYYSDYDQQNVLSLPDGPHGVSFEELAAEYNVTYMIGNDQPRYQSWERIRSAGMGTGYRFEVTAFKVASDNSIVTVKNTGIAPLYYDAYPAVNDVRSPNSLKGLAPGEAREFLVLEGGSDVLLSIESDRLVPGQEIEFDAAL